MTRRLLLHSGSVLDVDSGKVRVADVLIVDDRIVDVGTRLDGDEGIDCSGGLLLPGLIDCHTHVCLSQTMRDPFGLPRSARPLSAVPVLRTLLSRGITTVRDAWGADAGVRLAVEKGWIEGPEVLVSLRQVCTTGGIGDHWSGRSTSSVIPRCRIRCSTGLTEREPSYGGWCEPERIGSS